MPPAPLSSYDEVPYDTRPRASTHPDTLATVATLLGMRPAPVRRCRALELGCGTGGNLLALADALPESEFVGLDLSARQIDMGRQVVAAVGMTNLRLEARGILDVDPSLGVFDFIICHGVYSWVGEAERDGILTACKGLLAPQGVAYVSYNTYPGWHLRAPVRDMMNHHARDAEGPRGRVARAREWLRFLAHALPAPEGTWARVVRDEAETLASEGDYYLLHEHLDAENHAVHFHQFAGHARRHGLQYLGEAGTHLTLAAFPPDVRETLQAISPDLEALEQYVDFLKCRSFRRTLLVHDHVRLERSPGPGVLEPFLLAGVARPEPAAPDVCSPAVVAFRNHNDHSVETNVPITKAALLTLFEAWPRALPFGELWQRAVDRLDAGGVAVPPEARARLAGALVELFLSDLVGLHTYVPPFTTAVSARPEATPLTRLLARGGAPVCNRRHRELELSGVDRAVLALLDGRHDRTALLDGLFAQVREGRVELRRGGVVVSDPGAVREVLAAEVEASLRRLADGAVLVG